MSALKQLRIIALLEGTSFLFLLLVAMPLKYLYGMPTAVRIAGSVHGLLFLLFMAALLRAAIVHRWSPRRSAVAFGASLVPGGTYLFDRSLKQEMETLSQPT